MFGGYKKTPEYSEVLFLHSTDYFLASSQEFPRISRALQASSASLLVASLIGIALVAPRSVQVQVQSFLQEDIERVTKAITQIVAIFFILKSYLILMGRIYTKNDN
jgi:hypothetical protein